MKIPRRIWEPFFAIAAVLLIPFVWQQDLCLGCPIKFERFAAYFSILAAIGTTASLWFIYKQVEVAAKAHQPNITIEDASFYMRFDADENNPPKVFRENDGLITAMPHAFFLITNSGTSSAFDVITSIEGRLKKDKDNLAMMDNKQLGKIDVHETVPVRISVPLLNFIRNKLTPDAIKYGVSSTFETHNITLTIKYADNDNVQYPPKIFILELFVYYRKIKNDFYVRLNFSRIKK